MATHISARVAWHANGWNGRICREPAANTYCVGTQSYPGQLIAEKGAKKEKFNADQEWPAFWEAYIEKNLSN